MHIRILEDYAQMENEDAEDCGVVSHNIPFNRSVATSLKFAQMVGKAVFKAKARSRKADIVVLDEHVELNDLCMMNASLPRSRGGMLSLKIERTGTNVPVRVF